MATMDPENIREQATAAVLNKAFAKPPVEVVQKRKPGRPPKKQEGTGISDLDINLKDVETYDAAISAYNQDKALFVEGLKAVMQSYGAKTPDQIKACVPGAEAFVKIVKERFE